MRARLRSRWQGQPATRVVRSIKSAVRYGLTLTVPHDCALDRGLILDGRP
jgi:hypothetical protein